MTKDNSGTQSIPDTRKTPMTAREGGHRWVGGEFRLTSADSAAAHDVAHVVNGGVFDHIASSW